MCEREHDGVVPCCVTLLLEHHTRNVDTVASSAELTSLHRSCAADAEQTQL
jgi:hypothetical protein